MALQPIDGKAKDMHSTVGKDERSKGTAPKSLVGARNEKEMHCIASKRRKCGEKEKKGKE